MCELSPCVVKFCHISFGELLGIPVKSDFECWQFGKQ